MLSGMWGCGNMGLVSPKLHIVALVMRKMICEGNRASHVVGVICTTSRLGYSIDNTLRAVVISSCIFYLP